MFRFLKYVIQLILSPRQGWKDLQDSNPDPEEMLSQGLYPLLGIAAATEFLGLIYERHVTLAVVLMRAIGDFGAYFVSVFIARLIFELYLGRVTADKPDMRRVNTMTVCGLGMMVLFQIITNCLPWNLVLLKFLPFYVVPVLYMAIPYIGISRNCELRFTGIASGAIVGVPLVIYYLLYLLIQ